MALNAIGLAVGGSSVIGVCSLFGSLYWWCVRPRFVSNFTLSFQKYLSSDAAIFDVRVVNRGRRKIVVEAISVLFPFSILADDQGEPWTAGIVPGDQDEFDHVEYSKVDHQIAPGSAAAWAIVVCCLGRFQAGESIAVKLHFRTTCPILHPSKALTAAPPHDPIS